MTQISENIKYWLALKFIDGLGNIGVRNLLQSFGEPERIFQAPVHRLAAVTGIGAKTAAKIKDFRDWKHVEEEMKTAAQQEVAVLPFLDPRFPKHLLNIYDCPFLLYVKGELPVSAFNIAVVGSRKASAYGRYATEGLCRELALHGVVVISGMARGIDAAAHRGALSVKGKTVAVLGSGLDFIYPPENESLYFEICNCGAVVTEFPFGTRPNAPNFPARNRIISGLSIGVVVVEATEKSGSLITARIALEQGREVFAVPGSIDAAGSRGTNRLIKEGAKLVENVNDILEEIGPQAYLVDDTSADSTLTTTRAAAKLPPPARRHADDDAAPGAAKPASSPQRAGGGEHGATPQSHLPLLTEKERLLINNLSSQPRFVDDLIVAAGLSASEALAILLQLELKGLIRPLPGKKYILQEQSDV